MKGDEKKKIGPRLPEILEAERLNGRRKSRKDLVLSEIRGSEDIVGRPSAVLFTRDVAEVEAEELARRQREPAERGDDDDFQDDDGRGVVVDGEPRERRERPVSKTKCS